MYGAVGMRVTYGAGLEADLASAWTHDFPTGRVHHTWIATEIERVWVGRGDVDEVLEPGGVAVLAGCAPIWVGTRSARNPPPRVDDPLFPAVGVHHGEVAFGPLMPEVLGLPELLTTMQPQDNGWDTGSDVVLTLRHLGSLVGQRWPGPPQDALAEMVVTTALSTWRPPVLRDNSLTRCINAIAGPGPPPTVPELAALANTSERTLRRRSGRGGGRLRVPLRPGDASDPRSRRVVPAAPAGHGDTFSDSRLTDPVHEPRGSCTGSAKVEKENVLVADRRWGRARSAWRR